MQNPIKAIMQLKDKDYCPPSIYTGFEIYDEFREFLLNIESVENNTRKQKINYFLQKILTKNDFVVNDLRLILSHTKNYYRTAININKNNEEINNELLNLIEQVLIHYRPKKATNKIEYNGFKLAITNFLNELIEEELQEKFLGEILNSFIQHFFKDDLIILNSMEKILHNFNPILLKTLIHNQSVSVKVDLSSDYFKILNKKIATFNNDFYKNNKKIIYDTLLFLKEKDVSLDYFDFQEIFSNTLLNEYQLELLDWYRIHFNIEPLHLKKSHVFYKKLSKEALNNIKTFSQERITNTTDWSWSNLKIMPEFYSILQQANSLKEIIQHFEIKTNKQLINFLHENIERPSALYELKFLSSLNASPEILYNLLSLPNHLDVHVYKKLKGDVNLLQDWYSIKRISILIKEMKSNNNQNSYYLFNHTIDMIKIVNQFNINNPEYKINELLIKPKNFQELHDFLSIITLKLKQNNFKLPQTHLLYLEKFQHPELILRVPRFNHELIELGSTLKICVGSGSYAQRILNNYSNILMIYSKETHSLLYCIEISKDKRILEAKGMYNSPLDQTHKNVLSHFILTTQE